MGWEAWTTFSVVLLVLGLLAFTRAGPDLIFIGAVTLLITFGVLTPEQAVSGLSNEGVITVGALYIVAAGLRETGVMAVAAQRLLGTPKSILNVQLRTFAMAIMFAASLGFSTPLGYRTHLMVYGPGGYRFTDFLRMGIPLNLLMGAIAVTLIPFFWPFVPG